MFILGLQASFNCDGFEVDFLDELNRISALWRYIYTSIWMVFRFFFMSPGRLSSCFQNSAPIINNHYPTFESIRPQVAAQLCTYVTFGGIFHLQFIVALEKFRASISWQCLI